MLTETIYISDRNTLAIKVLMGIGILLAFAGVFALLYYLFASLFILYVKSLWQIFFLIFQGVLAIYISLIALKGKKYFIAWNAEEIRFFLPDKRVAERVAVNEIRSVEVSDREVVIRLQNKEEKRINLNLFYRPKREKVVLYFKGLK